MAARKNRAADRPLMDMSGQPPEAAAPDVRNFLVDAAEDDRLDAKTKHLNKGLRTAKDLLATMTKSAAHGLASDSDAIKDACLEELAELGGSVRDSSRAAKRSATKENRNLQE